MNEKKKPDYKERKKNKDAENSHQSKGLILLQNEQQVHGDFPLFISSSYEVWACSVIQPLMSALVSL